MNRSHPDHRWTDTHTWLRRLAATAATLEERAEGPFETLPTADLEARRARWIEVLGDEAALDRRLAWSELDGAQALADVALPEDAPLPRWTATLADLLDRLAPLPEGGARFVRDGLPLSFEDLWAPFVQAASARVSEAVDVDAALAETALAAFERDLLLLLCRFGHRTLGLEFTVFRNARESAVDRLLRQASSGGSSRLYRAFCDGILRDRYRTLFAAYPGLARAVVDLVLGWEQQLVGLCTHLAADREALQARLGLGPGPALAALAGLSDRHHGGRTVAILEFADGARVVYKPRPLGMDAALVRLADALEDLGAPFRLRFPEVVLGEDHGWAEHIEHTPCEGTDGVEAFYHRAGALLAVLQLLQTTDCHHENVVASGADLVLIDAEAVLHPRRHRAVLQVGDTALGQVAAVLRDAPLSVGLLPAWRYDGQGNASDTAGLSGEQPQLATGLSPAWVGNNTDDLRLEHRRAPIRMERNLPVLDGERIGVLDHDEALVEGFRATWAFLAAHRDAVHDLLDDFQGAVARFVARPTQVYGDLMRGSTAPECLRAGWIRGLHLDYLAAPLVAHEERPAGWSLLAAERRALHGFDIPHFEAPVDRDVVRGPGLEAGGLLAGPALDHAHARLDALDPADLELQLRLVQAALFCKRAGADGRTSAPPVSPAAEAPAPLEQALGLGQLLADQGIRGEDGSLAWLSCEPVPGGKHLRIQPAPTGLYAGSAGVGLFFAALARETGDAVWADRARAALASARRPLGPNPPRPGLTGAASAVYALEAAATWLEDPALHRDAADRATELDTEALRDDVVYDVIGGAAGTILALDAVADRLPEVLPALRTSAEHLLTARVAETDLGLPGFQTLDGRCLCGFSHGAAGIALALDRAAARTGESRFSAAADEALAFERAAYDPDQADWPDRRTDAGGFMCAWCHGAPGIAMARARLQHRAGARSELEHAIARTRSAGLGATDHLCCGALGLADALLVAGRTADRADWVKAGRQRVDAVARRAAGAGRFLPLVGAAEGLQPPGFFTGLAGIGYQLLRAADPDRHPSVAALEPIR